MLEKFYDGYIALKVAILNASRWWVWHAKQWRFCYANAWRISCEYPLEYSQQIHHYFAQQIQQLFASQNHHHFARKIQQLQQHCLNCRGQVFLFKLGQPFAQGVQEILGEYVTVQIAKRSELHTFKFMPKRWVVERSFA